MRLILGRFVLLLMIIFCFYFSFNDYRYPHAINILMVLWTIVLLALGLWTLKSPRIAFVSILLFYISTIIYRLLVLDGEILVYFLAHIIFTVSMVLSIWAAYAKNK